MVDTPGVTKITHGSEESLNKVLPGGKKNWLDGMERKKREVGHASVRWEKSMCISAAKDRVCFVLGGTTERKDVYLFM